MTKRLHMVAPRSEIAKPKGLRVPRLFLAMMLTWAGLSEIFLPPGDQGPVAQFSKRLAQEWQETIARTERMVP
jgi:hypothetical protein